VFLVAVEVLFHLFPRLLPGGVYGAGRPDAELGLSVHARELIYKKVRYVRKEPNSRGFLDVEHAVSKPPGAIRIGFFGDSFVESAQVPTEQAFFRRLPARVGAAPLEPLAFGISGWGTLHAWLASTKEAGRYPGDSLSSLVTRRHRSLPYALPDDSPEGFTVVPPDPEGPAFAVAKLLQQNSYLIQLVLHRARLLRDRGVPRGEAQLRGEIRVEDTWRPWLRGTSQALGIELVDPGPELARVLANGATVYNDHWSADGHAAIARVIEGRLESWIEARRGR